jgi:N-acyl-D-aspartate/D-glutamate deacylase
MQPDAAEIRVHAQAQAPYDLVIRNGRIIDGTGSPWYRADVAVRGDTIALIAPSITDPAAQVIDANGQIVSPGFIDIHNHARETIFQLPSADNYIRQGVTTLIEGPDGGSPVPLGPFLDKLEATQKSINVGTFIGQGSVREAVIGRANRRPTPAELDKMRAFLEDGMKAGAFGMSTGLFYVPGAFTPIEEVIELAKVAGKYGGIYATHMRGEDERFKDALAEPVSIGKAANVPVEIWHLGPEELLVVEAGQSPQYVRRGDPGTPTSSVALPGGHPEGFIEAFSQLYSDFAERVTARLEKRSPKAASLFAPDAVTGTRVMAFIEAVLKSGQANSAWTRI